MPNIGVQIEPNAGSSNPNSPNNTANVAGGALQKPPPTPPPATTTTHSGITTGSVQVTDYGTNPNGPTTINLGLSTTNNAKMILNSPFTKSLTGDTPIVVKYIDVNNIEKPAPYVPQTPTPQQLEALGGPKPGTYDPYRAGAAGFQFQAKTDPNFISSQQFAFLTVASLAIPVAGEGLLALRIGSTAGRVLGSVGLNAAVGAGAEYILSGGDVAKTIEWAGVSGAMPIVGGLAVKGIHAVTDAVIGDAALPRIFGSPTRTIFDAKYTVGDVVSERTLTSPEFTSSRLLTFRAAETGELTGSDLVKMTNTPASVDNIMFERGIQNRALDLNSEFNAQKEISGITGRPFVHANYDFTPSADSKDVAKVTFEQARENAALNLWSKAQAQKTMSGIMESMPHEQFSPSADQIAGVKKPYYSPSEKANNFFNKMLAQRLQAVEPSRQAIMPAGRTTALKMPRVSMKTGGGIEQSSRYVGKATIPNFARERYSAGSTPMPKNLPDPTAQRQTLSKAAPSFIGSNSFWASREGAYSTIASEHSLPSVTTETDFTTSLGTSTNIGSLTGSLPNPNSNIDTGALTGINISSLLKPMPSARTEVLTETESSRASRPKIPTFKFPDFESELGNKKRRHKSIFEYSEAKSPFGWGYLFNTKTMDKVLRKLEKMSPSD